MSDVFRMLAVVGAYEYDGTGDRFCAKNYVRSKVRCFSKIEHSDEN